MSLIVLVIFLQFLMATLTVTEPNIATDQAALLQLRAHITLDPYNFFAYNWSTSESPCNWVGVTCGARHRRVTSLNLSNMSLGGTLPPHMGNLSFLVSLNIRGNNFQGPVPKELVLLRRLKMIDLAYNSFSGSFPDDICKSLSNLESLDISSNELSGQLPSSLGDCLKIKGLLLGNNKFTGAIPQSIGNLTQLVELFLDDNNLEGPVPPTIFNISSLKSIYLANNTLSGSLPIDLCQSLPSIEELNLYRNKFTETIPKDIGNCTLLKRLTLRDNYLTGEIPAETGNLYNLKLLEIGGNNLTGTIPSVIFNISSIEVIQLSENRFTGNFPSSLGRYLPNLEGLYVLANNLRGTIPSSICNASKILDLELGRNSFSGLIPDTFGNCRQLQWLSLAFNGLTTESSVLGWSFLSALANCRYLRVLAMANNPLKAILPISIGNLSTSLEYFYAYASQLRGIIPVEIGNLSNLVGLSLYENELTGAIPATVGKLKKLQGLDLSFNKLHGSIPSDLCGLERLNLLVLNSNELQGSIPACLDALTSLRKLLLGSNKLNSTIPSTFWTLRDILLVELSSNSLSGSLPLDIGKLQVLISLDLSDNQLSGYVPSSIGDLKDLTILDLAGNQFKGPIPKSFGSSLSLEMLDLARNNLSGVIPKSLESLSHLNYFNVSYNGLEGEIPTEGPFVNFSFESFMSNPGLCGSPRLHVPICKTSSTQRSKRFSTHVLRYILPVVLAAFLVLGCIIIFIRYGKRVKSHSVQDDSLNLAALRRIPYHELQQMTDGFSESNLLGTGSFGSVYKGRLADGMVVAIKVFNLQLDGALESFDAECEVLRGIRHRNLVKIINSYSNADFKAIILQHMPKGNLEKWLYSHDYFLDILQRLDIMIDVASALEYLHHGFSTPVIHCDLKPSNVLLDDHMVAHVCDFGIAKLLGADSFRRTSTLATIGYMAPEYGLEGIVSTSCDVYSFGILLMETFTRKKPTDEMFVGEMSLKRWVEGSLPDAITNLVDGSLLSDMEDHFAAKRDCISSIMALALSCSAQIPQNRVNMKEAVVSLKKIKTKFLKAMHDEGEA